MNRKEILLLAIIICIGAFLRLIQLHNIPIALNPDETAIGYNAYSFLKTGNDEFGNTLPLAYKSFGDWKLIGYPLVTSVFIALGGLNEFMIRLPSALCGIIDIFLIFIISSILFNNKNIGLLASFLFTLNPWSIYFSRIAYEANLALTLFLSGIVCLLLIEKYKKHYTLLVYLCSLFFSLTFFIYHSYIIFIPIFVLLLVLFWKRIYSGKLRNNHIGALFILLIALLIVIIGVILPSQDKLSTLFITNSPNIIHNRVNMFRGDTTNIPNFLEIVFHNKYQGIVYDFLQKFIVTFSPGFLFDTGSAKPMHSLGFYGNFLLIDLIIIISGIYKLIKVNNKKTLLLFFWLLAGIVPSALTNDAPSSTRLLTIMPIIVIVAAYGAYYLLLHLFSNKLLYKFIGVILVILYLTNSLMYLEGYFFHMNIHRARYLHYGYKQVVELIQQYPNHKVVMVGPDNFPYISFLFYTKYDPTKFSKEVTKYPKTNEGFEFVQSFDRYNFVTNINQGYVEPATIYIDYPKKELDIIAKKNNGISGKIALPNGEDLFQYQINN